MELLVARASALREVFLCARAGLHVYRPGAIVGVPTFFVRQRGLQLVELTNRGWELARSFLCHTSEIVARVQQLQLLQRVFHQVFHLS